MGGEDGKIKKREVVEVSERLAERYKEKEGSNLGEAATERER